MSVKINTNPLRDIQTIPPTRYCRCVADLYGDEEECPDCKEENEE